MIPVITFFVRCRNRERKYQKSDKLFNLRHSNFQEFVALVKHLDQDLSVHLSSAVFAQILASGWVAERQLEIRLVAESTITPATLLKFVERFSSNTYFNLHTALSISKTAKAFNAFIVPFHGIGNKLEVIEQLSEVMEDGIPNEL